MQTRILSESQDEIETVPRLFKGFFLNKRYTIGEFLGEGGIAYNYVAEDIITNKKLVIKQTRRVQKITGKISEDRFQMEREYRILSELKSPYLPQAVDMFEIDNILYVVREFRDGVLLTELMETGYSLEALANICWQVLDILEYLHDKEIVYRDLKPSNILVDNYGKLFLLDFGTARYYHRGKKHDTIYLGTPGFAPPEQYGTAQTTQASDIYSFGALLYYLITGENPEDMPFEFATYDNIHKKIIHKSMAEFLCKCLEMNPAKRFQNTKDVRFILFEGNIFKTPYLHQEKIFEICFKKLTWKRINFLEVACTVWLSIWLICAAFTVAFNIDVQDELFGDHITMSEVIHPDSYFLRKGITSIYSVKREIAARHLQKMKAIGYFDLALKVNPLCKEACLQKLSLLNDMGYYDKAQETLEQLIDMDPSGWNCYKVMQEVMERDRFMREYETKKAAMKRISGDGKLPPGLNTRNSERSKIIRFTNLHELWSRYNDEYMDSRNLRILR